MRGTDYDERARRRPLARMETTSSVCTLLVLATALMHTGALPLTPSKENAVLKPHYDAMQRPKVHEWCQTEPARKRSSVQQARRCPRPCEHRRPMQQIEPIKS